MIPLTGGLLAFAAAMLLYADHRPKGRGVASRRLLVRAGGWLLVVASLALFLLHFGPATAIFVHLLVLMLSWTVAPLIVAWVRRPAGGK